MHISKFGGHPHQVAIGIESSEAGSVIFQALAYGGEELGILNNAIATSPYIPVVHRHSDSVSTAYSKQFPECTGYGEYST